MVIEVQLGNRTILELPQKFLQRLLVEGAHGDLRAWNNQFAHFTHLWLRAHIRGACRLQVKDGAEDLFGDLCILQPGLVVSDTNGREAASFGSFRRFFEAARLRKPSTVMAR